MIKLNMSNFKKGDIVRVNPENDNENYKSFRNKNLRIIHVAHNTMEHPGFDDSMKGEGLYDFEIANTGEKVHCSLYDYELIKIK